ncbi:hypothetical protein ACFUTV_41165 [Streptomyces sp. NPDC057298]|uniref:hypothetical protein n=1 Tax=Streptomyces sp. NPDC057298 TaxID=3346091 RepID=UPI003641440A
MAVESDEVAAKEMQRSAAEQALQISHARSAAVRYRFIARGSEGSSPPLARLLRGSGGRGGATRLKLYLSMLWLARNEDRPVFQYPALTWALLLGYGDGAAGVRRVQEALRWLDREAFVELRRRQGATSAVHLLSDAGVGSPYTAPGIAIKTANRAQREDHLYVQIPAGLWTNGWISELSGAAIAMFMVLLHERRGDSKQVWISPRIGRELYDLSDETRRKGLTELADHRLIKVSKRPLHQGLFEDPLRTRHVYDLTPDILGQLDPDDPPSNSPAGSSPYGQPADPFAGPESEWQSRVRDL